MRKVLKTLQPKSESMDLFLLKRQVKQMRHFPSTPSSETKESMSTADIEAPDVSALSLPAELHIKALAQRLKVGVRDLAAAAGIGTSTFFQLMTLNQWPKRQVVRKDRVLELLRTHGAKDAELDIAFECVAQPMAGDADDTPIYPKETEMLMGKQTLSMAARKQFSLFSNPFDAEVSSEDDMFVSSEIRFIREACWQCANNGSFVAVMGESGAGKTTILADLKDRVQAAQRPVIMIEPSVLGMGTNERTAKLLKSGDILSAGISTLDPNATIKIGIEARTRQFIKLLETSVSAGNAHMVVIEEAHDLPVLTLKHLKRLHEAARIGRRSALGILLVAHPELRDKLNERQHAVREVYQRCEMITLQPLDGDLEAYLAHKCKVANRSLDELFSDDGIAEIRNRLTVERRINNSKSVRKISLLYPLAVNNVVTAALNEAAELGVPVVNADVVRGL